MKQTILLISLTALLGACASDHGGGGKPGKNTAELKAKARAALENGGSAGPGDDVCVNSGWNGDGTCDDWCPDGDEKDCTVCTQELRDRDGTCAENDPCDPDCAAPGDGDSAGDGDGIVCPAIFETTKDGKCDSDNPCARVSDPDCQDDGGIACTAIYKEPDGCCDPSDPCSSFQDGDCIGVACIAIVYETNGKCEAGVGCEGSDPVDCAHTCPANPDPAPEPDPIVCTDEVRPSDGSCDDKDPCDPDCLVTIANP
jgi:hypothetical protein